MVAVLTSAWLLPGAGLQPAMVLVLCTALVAASVGVGRAPDSDPLHCCALHALRSCRPPRPPPSAAGQAQSAPARSSAPHLGPSSSSMDGHAHCQRKDFAEAALQCYTQALKVASVDGNLTATLFEDRAAAHQLAGHVLDAVCNCYLAYAMHRHTPWQCNGASAAPACTMQSVLTCMCADASSGSTTHTCIGDASCACTASHAAVCCALCALGCWCVCCTRCHCLCCLLVLTRCVPCCTTRTGWWSCCVQSTWRGRLNRCCSSC